MKLGLNTLRSHFHGHNVGLFSTTVNYRRVLLGLFIPMAFFCRSFLRHHGKALFLVFLVYFFCFGYVYHVNMLPCVLYVYSLRFSLLYLTGETLLLDNRT
jgi:hypothetical protein